MKVRQGFVSNSSSSSFILRGMKFKKEELIAALNIIQEEIDECNDDYEVMELISSKLSGPGNYGDLEKFKAKIDGITLEEEKLQLDLHETGNYFGDIDYDNLIVGKFMGSFDDGEVTEIGGNEGWIDDYVTRQLAKIGLSGTIKTYVQMVSNDNY